MADMEKKIYSPQQSQEFQPIIKYKDAEKSPIMIASQTWTLLGLLHQGAIRKPELAKDYLHDYTFPYLNQAEKGCNTLFDRKGKVFEDIDLETKEAAHHAFIVFAHMPDQMTSAFLPMGFSRRIGMLKAPATKDEFLDKIEEIKIEVWRTADGRVNPGATLEAFPRLLRTYGFFRIGSMLPIKQTESEQKKEQIEKEKFEEFLKDVNVSF